MSKTRRLSAGGERFRGALAALAGGVLLFWIARTAAERRVLGPAGLFSFGEGCASPAGMAALMAAGLLLCAFLALTVPGIALRRRLRALMETDGGLWLLSLAVTGVFVLWAMRVTVMSYMTNDDVFFLRDVSRISSEGLGAANSTFSNILFGWMIGGLYAAAPNGYWYIGYHIALLTASLTVIGRCLLWKARARGWPPAAGCLLHLALCGGVFLIAYAQVSFTVTPAVAGSAATALMLCRDGLSDARRRTASDIGSGILMLLCYMQRRQTGIVLFCFWLLAIVYQAVRLLLAEGKSGRRKLVGLGAAAASVLLLAALLRVFHKANPYYDAAYWDAEYYRSAVMDYLIDRLSFETYAEAGVPQELAVLLHGWFFMDERIGTDLFITLSRLYNAGEGASAGAGPAAVITALGGAVASDPNMLYRALAAVAALGFCGAEFVRRGRRYWPEFLCALAALGGGTLICLYTAAQGRFILRVFLVAAFPAIVTILCMALALPPEGEGEAPVRRPAAGWACGVLAAAFLVLCGLSAHSVPTAAESVTRADLFGDQWTVESYAREHAEITYVTNMYADNLDPFHSAYYPENIVLWGAMGDTARTDRLYADAFFREDVRFLCRNPMYIAFVLQYLTLEHGPVAALDEAHLTDRIYVYDISRITPGDGFTGWYDWNGLTYYFRDGAALSGEQVIDGVKNAFGPVGAASPLTPVSAEEGTYYTTGAYVLQTGE